MQKLKTYLTKKDENRFCTICGKKMSYFSNAGIYKCMQCNYTERDTYGKIKDLLEMNPNLSKMELSMILHIPMRELNSYIEDGILINPKLY